MRLQRADISDKGNKAKNLKKNKIIKNLTTPIYNADGIPQFARAEGNIINDNLITLPLLGKYLWTFIRLLTLLSFGQETFNSPSGHKVFSTHKLAKKTALQETFSGTKTMI